MLMALALAMQAATLKSPQDGFYSELPASKWEEYLLSGNGTMGTMVAGRPYNERIVFNHTNLFMPIFDPLIPPSQGNHLAELQALLSEGKYQEASERLVEISHADGFGRKRQSDLFIPAFELTVVTDSLATRDYTRQVDFTTGEISVSWQNKKGKYSRNTFVSRADNVIATQYVAHRGKINATFDLQLITTNDPKRKVKFGLDDNFNIKKADKTVTPEWLTMAVWYQKPWKGGYEGYAGAIRVVAEDGDVEEKDGKLVVKGATKLTLIGRVEPSRQLNSGFISSLQETVAQAPADYSQLLERHTPIHGNLMGRVKLNLNSEAKYLNLPSEKLLAIDHSNPAVIEKMFAAARYNILSSTGVNPPNLQGIWGATMTPPWAGDYTTNGNLPTAVSHYLDAGTPELMLPLFDKLESFMDYFKTNARVLFNCRGIHIPSHICLHGYDNQFDATWPMTFWTAGAAWYSIFYYDYYLHTLDLDFLRQRALPFMEQAALFYEDFLQLGEDGRYVFNPSYSPENHPGNSKSQACLNATMDVMAAKGLLRALIAASQTLGTNADKLPVWQNMLDRMPPYEVGPDGCLREGMWKNLTDNHEHRHASHLLGMFYFRDPEIMASPELREGCRRVIDNRMAYRRSSENGGVMAFGISQLAFPACLLGDAETAHDLLVYAADNYWNNNMMTTHDSHSIFNADMSGAFPAMVMKMLAYSDKGLVSLLPACPWPSGSIEGMLLRGGVRLVRMEWNEKEVNCRLLSPIDQTVKLELRNKPMRSITLPAGKEVEISLKI